MAEQCPAVAVEGVTKVFRPPFQRLRRLLRRRARPVKALDGVDLAIPRGEIFGLVGRNGQGKTTLIKSIASLIEPTAGAIRVFGHDTRRDSYEVKRRVGLVSADERSFYGRLTGWQNLMFFARLNAMAPAKTARQVAELADWLEFTPNLHRKFHEYSTGNKQRLAILRALMTNAELILLDEPTRSLDPISADELRRLIRDKLNAEQGKTILITTHNLQEVEDLCGRVGIISQGRIRRCALMADLKRSHGARERVRLRVRGLAEPASLALRVPEAEGLVWQPLEEGRLEIGFTRQGGDDVLHRMLTALVALGGEIESCESRRDGLREIMDLVEAGEAAS